MANTIALSGNLTREPELRATPSGTSVLDFRIAVDKAAGQDEAGFFDCVAWGNLGENLSRSLTKGQRVVVIGQLHYRNYDDSKGSKRTVVEVTVDDAGPSLLWAQAQVTKVSPVRQAS